MHLRQISVLAAAALALTANAAFGADQKPELLGSFRDWHVYQTGMGADRLCYALSEPKATDPKNLKRDSIFFLISTWPGRKVRNEPSVVPGYQYKDGAMTDVQIGQDKFSFFTRNDNASGGAWIENPADEKRLIDSMKKGSEMIVTGISTRGTLTKDNYSLAGISAALDKVDSSCK